MASERDVAVEINDPSADNPSVIVGEPASISVAKDADAVKEPVAPTNDATEAPPSSNEASNEVVDAPPSAAPSEASTSSAVATPEAEKNGWALVIPLLFLLLSFSGGFVMGGVLIAVGVKQANAFCNFNFATFAVVYGALIIVYAGLTLIAAVAIANNHESGFGKNLDRFNRSLLAPCIGGVFIWGTVLAFSNNRWSDVMVSTPAGGAPCDMALYRPVAIIIITVWSLAAFACFFGCLFACCFMCCLGGADGLQRMQGQMQSPGHALRQVSSRRLR